MALTENEEDDEYFEDDVVFDRQQLLIDSSPALHRVSIKNISLTVHRISNGKFTICAKTFGLCGAFFGLGLCVAIPDFTFSSELSSDVQVITNNSFSTNWLTARSLGYIIGSFIAGFLFDRYNRQFLLFLSLLLTSVFIVVTPWCYTRMLLEINMVVLGITTGFLSTGGNVLCLDLWGRNSGPFMQALHFSFALGTLVAPLMAITISDQSQLEFNSSYHSAENNNSDYIILNRIRKEYGNSFAKLLFNRSVDVLYENNCHINMLSINTSDYWLYINFSRSAGISNRTVLTFIKYKLPSIRKIHNIQRTIINTFLPVQCKFTTSDGHSLNDSDSFNLFDICDSKKSLLFNSSEVDGHSNKKQLDIKTCDCSTYLLEGCKNIRILASPSTSVLENSTFSDYGDYRGAVECNSSLFDSEIANGPINSSIMHIFNLTCTTPFNFSSLNYSGSSVDHKSEMQAYKGENYRLSDYHLTYFLTGAVNFTLAALFFVFLCRNPRDPKSKQEEFRTKSKKISNICVDLFLVPLTAWFLFLCVGLQATINQLLSLYAVKIRKMLPSLTDNLQTIFSASFTTMRLASVFFAIGFSPDTLLVINIIMFSFGTLILTSFGNKSNEALCTGCSVIGLGLASMVPTTILWIEQYIRVSNKITVVFVVGSTLGEMLFPFTVYKLMVLNSDVFLYVTILVNVLSSFTLVCLWLIMGKHAQKFCLGSHTGYHLANQNDEEDLSMTNILKCLRKN